MTQSRDGVEIACSTHGTGEPAVVLVHGWLGNRSYWDSQVAALAGHQVVTVDLGGHGESGLGREDWGFAGFTDDLLAVVDELSLERMVLVGHSMGGDVVLEAARRLGDRVVGIVWVDAFRSLGHEPVSGPADVEAFVAPFRADFPSAVEGFARGMFSETADPALADRVVADMRAAPREVALGSIQYALNREPAILAGLAEVKAPVVAINPEGPTDAESLRSHGVEVHLLAGVGHFSMLEDPEQLNRVLLDVLAALS
jgi:pimeloyl-ACP methyl ester carboxylesterase